MKKSAAPSPLKGRRSAVICGRKCCRGRCGRWRIVATDFGVNKWLDHEKTVAEYRSRCEPCLAADRRDERARKAAKRGDRRKLRTIRKRAQELIPQPLTAPSFGSVRRGWADTGNGWVEEVVACGGTNDKTVAPITPEAATAWSEEMPPRTEFRSGWWRQPSTEGLALVA